MRISDWSSDVCSSDLPAPIPPPRPPPSSACPPAASPSAYGPSGGSDDLPAPGHRPDAPRRRHLRPDPRAARHPQQHHHRPRPPADRKSVVQGKRVSVRVDLGGRRNIKKKTTTK